MIRIPVVILAVMLCCSLAAGVSAEGLLPGMPSFGGWNCAPGHKADCSLKGELGYLGYNRGLVFEMGPTGGTFSGLIALREQYPIEGLWIGASVVTGGSRRGFSACDPGDGLCLGFAASWLAPNNKEGVETGPFGGATFFRTWTPRTQWYTLEASVSSCMESNFTVIGGFRYDSFSTAFSDPGNFQLISASTSDEAELSLTSYIPYIGAETSWGPVKVGVRGFPWVPGAIQFAWIVGGNGNLFRISAFGNYRNAYFLETFLEVGRQIRAVDISAFATYTVLHVTGEFDASLSVPGSVAQPFNFSVDRQNWIVGGKAAIGFNSPI